MRIILTLLVVTLLSCTNSNPPENLEPNPTDTLIVTDTIIYWDGYELINESP